jgi:hypothetical protein
VAALLVLLLAIVGAVFLTRTHPTHDPAVPAPNAVASTPDSAVPARDPVVVLMDTTASTGVYDADNRTTGGSNAREVSKALMEMGVLPARSLNPVSLFAGWDREAYVCSLRPHLVVIHRSSFHHSYNALFNFGSTNEFSHAADDPKWRFLYDDIGDDKLITLLAYIGAKVPHTQFLVYSRGTDTNWLRDDFRAGWVKKIEARFKELEGRITTMVIPHHYQGSFRQDQTRELLRSNVVAILKLPQKAR